MIIKLSIFCFAIFCLGMTLRAQNSEQDSNKNTIQPYHEYRPDIEDKMNLLKKSRKPASLDSEKDFDGPDYPSFMGY